MKRDLNYTINNEYMIEKGQGLCEIVKEWLISQGVDVLVYDFTLGNMSSMIVDFSFDDNITYEEVKDLTEQILNRFNIEFELE